MYHLCWIFNKALCICNQETELPNKAHGDIRDEKEWLVFHLLTHQVCSGTSQSWHISGSMRFSTSLFGDSKQMQPSSMLTPPSGAYNCFLWRQVTYDQFYLLWKFVLKKMEWKYYQGGRANTLNGLTSNHSVSPINHKTMLSAFFE